MSFRRSLIVLSILAFLVFTANAGKLSLLSLDDCFYARKGVEMARSGRFLTVTWNYKATFQNPPLQFWIIGQSFRLFGENDFAARLPSIFMGLGILFLTFKIAKLLTTPQVGLTAVSMLLITPHFLSNARRCMLEIPLTFWTCFAILLFLKGQTRLKLNALLALPIGAALLTKSLLGLLPLFIFGTAAIFSQDFRKNLISTWFWIGIAGGILIGSTWPIHEYLRFGSEALREHYFGEILSRSVTRISIIKLILGYPEILLTVFLPVTLLAIPGIIKMIRAPRSSSQLILVAIWTLLPVILYSFSTARSSRYIFPILPALAIAGAYWIESTFPKIASVANKTVIPAILIVIAAIFWISPETLLKDENKLLKANHQLVRNTIPETKPAPYVGTQYWSVANPLMYYAERQLAAPAQAADAVHQAKNINGLIVLDASKTSEVQTIVNVKPVFVGTKWLLVTVE
ncbi:MAG TPA: glycosyltransferase family 39 protein [Acidobacteriota bacterium]|nr:glycosyltransferase family 39 protein [Acidobacteriota bacterium]